MTERQRVGIAATLNRLPMVRWDRCVDIPGGDFDVFGWIDRPDGRADFVLLTFPDRDHPGHVGYTTSSAEHSERIGELLHIAGAEHVPCRRVEHEFAELVERKVELA